ncbi:MAG: CARDB domain-containing protein, partial [bacterium]
MSIETPSNGQVFARAEVIVSGKITEDSQVAPTTTINGSPVTYLEQIGPTTFLFEAVVTLGVGNNVLTVRAVDASAKEGSDSVTVGHEEVNLVIDRVEATQSLQDNNNTLPVVAGKPTIVRLHYHMDPNTVTVLPGITGLLTVKQGGVTLATLSPTRSFTSLAKTIPDPQQVFDTLNFQLDTDLSGNITLEAELNPVGPTELPETTRDDNEQSVAIDIQDAKIFRLGHVPINYQPVNPDFPALPTGSPAMNMVWSGDAYIQSTYPISDLIYYHFDNLTFTEDLLDATDGNTSQTNLLNALGALEGLSAPKPDKVYGWLPGNPVPGINGLAWVPGYGAFGNTQASRYVRTAAHEIGHNYGFNHLGAAATLGSVGFDVYEFETKAPNLFDFMVAGMLTNQAWIWPNTLSTLYTGSFAAKWAAPKTSPLAAGGTFNPFHEKAMRQPQPLSMVVGRVYLDGSGEIERVFNFEGYSITPQPANSNSPRVVTVELLFLGEGGETLWEEKFPVSFMGRGTHDKADDVPMGVASFVRTFPQILKTRKVLMLVDGTEVFTLSVSTNDPKIEITSPKGGEKFSGEMPITWSAQDVDGDPLTFSVQYSPDNGQTFVSLCPWTNGTYLMVDTGTIAGTERGLIRVLATDGFNTAVAETLIPFSVAQKEPVALLRSPSGKYNVYRRDESIHLRVQGFDYEDGALTDDVVQWVLDGEQILGSGRSIDVTIPQVGSHVVSAVVTDSDRQQTVESKSILINKANPGSLPRVANADVDASGQVMPSGKAVAPEVYENLGVKFQWHSDAGGGLVAARQLAKSQTAAVSSPNVFAPDGQNQSEGFVAGEYMSAIFSSPVSYVRVRPVAVFGTSEVSLRIRDGFGGLLGEKKESVSPGTPGDLEILFDGILRADFEVLSGGTVAFDDVEFVLDQTAFPSDDPDGCGKDPIKISLQNLDPVGILDDEFLDSYGFMLASPSGGSLTVTELKDRSGALLPLVVDYGFDSTKMERDEWGIKIVFEEPQDYVGFDVLGTSESESSSLHLEALDGTQKLLASNSTTVPMGAVQHVGLCSRHRDISQIRLFYDFPEIQTAITSIYISPGRVPREGVSQIQVNDEIFSIVSSPIGMTLSMPFTIFNEGTGPLVIQDIQVEDSLKSTFDLSELEQLNGETISPKKGSIIEIHYTAKDTKPDDGIVTITSNDPKRPKVAVRFLGSGTSPRSERPTPTGKPVVTPTKTPQPDMTPTPTNTPLPGVTPSPPIVTQGVDLTTNSLRLSGSQTVVLGEEIGERITAVVKNIGAVDSGAFHVDFYLSTDLTISTDDVLLVQGREAVNGLAAGESQNVDVNPMMAIPETMAPGTYILGTIADGLDAITEIDETNNSAIIPITIVAALPDLRVTTFSLSGRGELHADEVIGHRLTTVVKNTGPVESGLFSVGFYLSTDISITTGDMLLVGGREMVDNLAAGESRQIDAASQMALPGELASGNYILGVIADEFQAIAEINERNNTSVIPITIVSTEPGATPTPTPRDVPKPSPWKVFEFSSVDEFTRYPGGFVGAAGGDVLIAPISPGVNDYTDGNGAIVITAPNQLELLLFPTQDVGDYLVLLRLSINARGEGAGIALAAL